MNPVVENGIKSKINIISIMIKEGLLKLTKKVICSFRAMPFFTTG